MATIAVVQVGGTALAARQQTGPRSLDVLGLLLLALGPTLLPTRHRWPVAAYGGVFVATLAYVLLSFPGGPIWLPLIITFGTVLIGGRRAIAYVSMPLGYLAFVFLPAWLGNRPPPSPTEAVGVGTWMLLLIAASELVRNRRAYLREAARRRAEAERMQLEERRREAGEQRLTIARELHDVLAHSISLINVQAGVALELIDQTQQVRNSLTAIKQTSKDALVEVETMLRTLRDEDALRVPAPGLAQLAQLTDSAASTGLQVDVETTGEVHAVPPGADLAAYRIIQEALTNTVRHAGAGKVRILIGYGTDELCVEVLDDGPGRSLVVDGPGGNGIRGMRERAALLGGDLVAGRRRHGGFRVKARLPLGQSREVEQGGRE